MAMQELQRIRKVSNLRDIWANKAHTFTPRRP